MRAHKILALAALGLASAAPAGAQVEEFEVFGQGRVPTSTCVLGELSTEGGAMFFMDGSRRGLSDGMVLRLDASEAGGEVAMTLQLSSPAAAGESFGFLARRVMKPDTLEVRLEFSGELGALGSTDLAPRIRKGDLAPVAVVLPEGTTAVRWVARSDGRAPIMLDRLERRAPAVMQLESASLRHIAAPVVPGREARVAAIEVSVEGTLDAFESAVFGFRLEEELALKSLRLDGLGRTFAGEAADGAWRVRVDAPLAPGNTVFELSVELLDAEDPDAGDPDAGDPDAGDAVEAPGDAAPPEAEAAPGLPFSPRVLIGGTLQLARASGPLDPVALAEEPASSSLVSEQLVHHTTATVDTTSMVSVGAKSKEAGPLVCAAGLVDPESRGLVRVFHWTADGTRSVQDLEYQGYQLARPALLTTRGSVRVLLAAEATPAGGDREIPAELVGFWSEDAGRSFGPGAPLDIVDDDDASLIGGCVRFTGGRGAIDGKGNWALPILRSYGHARKAAAILVSKDQGQTWVVSTEVLRGVETATIVALGESALLIDGCSGGAAVRRETSTLNGGVWWAKGLSDARPVRPASPQGTAYVHVGLDTGWGADARLVLATGPEGRAPGLAIWGSNNVGAIWHASRRRSIDLRAGSGSPSLSVIDGKRLAVAFRSGDGDLVFQVHPLGDYAAPVKTYESLFGPR